MSHAPLRHETDCLNCGAEVMGRFCSQCGQENVDARKSFYVLFLHFFEDLTHYENAFWKTIHHLLFKPASLTRAYLSGKRMSYLAPIRLYIFISFITFFSFSILQHIGTDEAKPHRLTMSQTHEHLFNMGYNTQSELNRAYELQKDSSWGARLEYQLASQLLSLEKKYSKAEFLEALKEAFLHNLPKLIIAYMPIFAFLLWLFHNKKKWYYFDHGIFTLHYFSFLLLIQTLLLYVATLLESFHHLGADVVLGILNLAGTLWMTYYFFPAHHRFYGGSRRKTLGIGILMWGLNTIIMACIFVAYFVYTILAIH